MKNRNKEARVVISAVLAMTILAACGKAEETMASGEMAVPKMSSEEMLVSSIEFLLRDDEVQTEGNEREDFDLQTGFAEAAGISRDLSESDEKQLVQDDVILDDEAVIYYGNGASSELSRKKVEVKDRTPEEVLKALAKHNIVSLDTKLLAFEEEEKDGIKALRIDLSKAAGEYLDTMSMEAESIIVSAVVNTYLENFDADAIRITVAGKPLTSPNRVYEEALGRCTPSELLHEIKAGEGGMETEAVEENDTAGRNSQDAEVDGKEGADADTAGKNSQDAEVDGKEGADADTAGKSSQDAEADGKEGADADTAGRNGQDAEADGKEGVDVE